MEKKRYTPKWLLSSMNRYTPISTWHHTMFIHSSLRAKKKISKPRSSLDFRPSRSSSNHRDNFDSHKKQNPKQPKSWPQFWCHPYCHGRKWQQKQEQWADPKHQWHWKREKRRQKWDPQSQRRTLASWWLSKKVSFCMKLCPNGTHPFPFSMFSTPHLQRSLSKWLNLKQLIGRWSCPILPWKSPFLWLSWRLVGLGIALGHTRLRPLPCTRNL